MTNYQNSGYFLKQNNTDYQGMMDVLTEIDLTDLYNTIKLEAIVVYGLYYVPSFDMWVLKTWLYEFPKDDSIQFRVNISPVKNQNLNYKIVKAKLALDILNLLLQLVLGLIKMFCSFKEGEKYTGIYFLSFNLTIFILLLVANLLYFDGYQGRDIQVGNVGFFSDINNKINISKQIMIVCLLLHSYQTFFSLKINTTSVYILAVIGYMQSWLWPLLLQYAIIITVFSFLVDNIVQNFNASIDKMPIIIFRLIANSNGNYWTLIINGSPVVFILIVVIAIFWIFYIVNNIYFGIQTEIVRICETAKNDYSEVQTGKLDLSNAKPKQLGLYVILKQNLVNLWRRLRRKKGEEQNEENNDDQ